MPDPSAGADAAAASDRAGWQERLAAIGAEDGHFEPLGERHLALFCDDGPVLLVTFERAEAIRAAPGDGLPAGLALARDEGWSSLCLIAEGDTWFRDPALYGYFDRLVRDGFFEDFDRVVIYGAGMCGYAACAYSVTAPGATVVAVQPVATLDPVRTGWDRRFVAFRRIGFTDRYGYAPDMTEGAGEVFVIHDPEQTLDAMHAALFARPHVRLLRCPNLGDRIDLALERMGLLAPLLHAAGEGLLTPALFFALYRNRRRYAPYLRNLMDRTDAASRPLLSALIARNVTARMAVGRFRRRLAEIEAGFAAEGRSLPPLRAVGP
jgi:hypothetical protein